MVNELIAGRYRLLERNGVGGMAAVWRARDERTGEQVALKQVHPHLVADPNARARLEREAEALRLVDHPAIARPRELVDDPEHPALVMDFVEGRSLADRIAEGPLPVEEAFAIAGTIADALAVAHSQGIVHRDIKPANILVEDNGTLHLIDFGIASLGTATPDGLTDASSMVGTLRYAAPERLAGEPASSRSDVWALGAVLYEMLTARPAVTGDDPAAVLAAGRTAGPDLADLPLGIRAVLARAMAVDPADRYRDAAAFRDAIDTLDAPVDPAAATAVIPLADPRTSPRLPSLSSGAWRAAAIGAGLTASLLLLVASMGASGTVGSDRAATGLGGPSSVPVATSMSGATPAATQAPATQGNRGKGHGHGKGKD
jgi:serine/threonine-protein kinase